jgi:hypothetical protein
MKYAKRSQMLKNIEAQLSVHKTEEEQASDILKVVELFMEPNLRPLTNKEVDDHVLVKQVHESRKEEVRNYVKNLDYELKREWVPEDT